MSAHFTERWRNSSVFSILKTVKRRLWPSDSKKLFSRRADDYARFRPSYPPAVLQFLKKKLKLNSKSRIADVGSGTGIFSKQLLGTGALVYGVEPNGPMREAAERDLIRFKNFKSVNGGAEDTTLEPGSLDLITAAQAFHWFKLEKARKEFQRILRPNGWVCVLWNIRNIEGAFLRQLDGINLRYRKYDAGDVNKKEPKDQKMKNIDLFFGKKEFQHLHFDHFLPLTLEGLLGFLRSQSYLPQAGTAKHQSMAVEVTALFKKHQRKNRVRMSFRTEVFWGRLREPQ